MYINQNILLIELYFLKLPTVKIITQIAQNFSLYYPNTPGFSNTNITLLILLIVSTFINNETSELISLKQIIFVTQFITINNINYVYIFKIV